MNDITIPQEDFDLLLETLIDVVNQACYCKIKPGESYYSDKHDYILDSMALSSNAHAMRLLAKYNKLKILDEYGRRIISQWICDDE